MKKVSCFIGALMLCSPIFATQDNRCIVNGKVIDSENQTPIAGASINLEDKEGNQVFSLKADPNGNFNFHIEKGHVFVVDIIAMGFQSRKVSITEQQSNRDTLGLGDIGLVSETKVLDEVNVTGKRNLIIQELGKIIYNVQEDPESQSQNIFETLRKVPLISIGANDEITMVGKGNFKVLINGRTSALTVGDPKDIFKTIPARMVQKIEVITHPPARYDSEGIGGIINVVMDQKIIYGVIGGVSAGVAKMSSNANGNIAVRFNKFSVSTNLNGFWEYPPLSHSTSIIKNRSLAQAETEQVGDIKQRFNVKAGSFAVGYELDTMNLFFFTASLSDGDNNQNNNLFTSIRYPNDDDIFFTTDNVYNSNTFKYSYDLNYEHRFKRNKEQILTASVNHNKLKSKNIGENIYSERVNFDRENFGQRNNASNNENTIQIDYAHPVSNVEISLGSKYIGRNGTSEFFPNIPLNSDIEGLISDEFDSKQEVYALYNSYSLKIKDWGISAGMRFENTRQRANFVTNETNINQNYHNFVPSILIQKKIKDISSINLGYTQRVQRPDISLMNPFINKSDPTFYFSGNPDLLPVTGHTVSIAYNWLKKGFINISGSYSFANNTIQRVVELGQDSISYSSYYNIGKNKQADLNLSANYPFSKALRMNFNGNLAYVDVTGSIGGELYKNTGTQGNAYVYLTYTWGDIATIYGNLGYYTPTVTLQGRSAGYVYNSIGANKRLLRNKMTVSFSVSNPFQEYRNVENRVIGPQFEQVHNYRNYFRNYSLSISYNFGKIEKPIKRNKKGIKNDDSIEKPAKTEKGSTL